MAFEKAVTLKGYPEATNAYHRIIRYEVNALDKILTVEFAIYYDQATRDANEESYLDGKSKTIIIKNWIDETDPDNPVERNDFNDYFLQDVTYKALYTWIKANDTFYSDATEI